MNKLVLVILLGQNVEVFASLQKEQTFVNISLWVDNHVISICTLLDMVLLVKVEVFPRLIPGISGPCIQMWIVFVSLSASTFCPFASFLICILIS